MTASFKPFNITNTAIFEEICSVSYQFGLGFMNTFLRPFLAPSRPLCGHLWLQIFRGQYFSKTATFEESGRNGGHLATLYNGV
jgi:hypothetical protein